MPVGTRLYKWTPGKNIHLDTEITHPVSLPADVQFERDLHQHHEDTGAWVQVQVEDYEVIQLFKA
jgi:hypothetical protein